MHVIVGRKEHWVDNGGLAELAARHRAVAIDVGTGDGAYARRLAASDPGLLVVGIDANADNLRQASRRAAGPEARGGLPTSSSGASPWRARRGRWRGWRTG